MRTKTRPLPHAWLRTCAVGLAAAGCAHYWERSGGSVEDFERESAACIENAKGSPYGPSSLEPVYRACMRGKGWKRVEVSVADNNQLRGLEDDADFLRPPSPMSGKRYSPTR